MSRLSYSAGGYDWLDIWRRMYDEERAQAERANLPGFEPQADCWAGQANRFAAAARQAPQPDGFMRFLLPRLRPANRLLDIGAGTGRYEPLLAGVVAEVLALEPSPAMRAQLEQRLAEARVSNVRVVAERWPEADLPACDVAIAAHVLYGVREIEPFLTRMSAVAARGCYLLLAIRHPSSFISPFWERLHGQARLPLPGALPLQLRRCGRGAGRPALAPARPSPARVRPRDPRRRRRPAGSRRRRTSVAARPAGLRRRCLVGAPGF